jgi:hypothetical protein
MDLTSEQQEVYDYLDRCRRGAVEPKPLAGMKLDKFRYVRRQLVEMGMVVQTLEGRYVPAERGKTYSNEAA